MTIKMTKDERGFARINGKVKALLEAHDISVQTIVDEWIEKNVVFIMDPKTQEVKPRDRLRGRGMTKAFKEKLNKMKKGKTA